MCLQDLSGQVVWSLPFGFTITLHFPFNKTVMWCEETVSPCSLRKTMCEALHASRPKGHWACSHNLLKILYFILVVLFKWLWATYWTTIMHTCEFVLLSSWIPQNPLNDVWTRRKSPGPGILTCNNNTDLGYLMQQQSFTHAHHFCSIHVS